MIKPVFGAEFIIRKIKIQHTVIITSFFWNHYEVTWLFLKCIFRYILDIDIWITIYQKSDLSIIGWGVFCHPYLVFIRNHTFLQKLEF